MSSVKQEIRHFLHREDHILTSTNDGHNYNCNACYLPGKGARYRCNKCDFDIHFLCAQCPKEIPLPTAGQSHRDRSLTGAPSSSNNRMTLKPQPERKHDGTSLRQCDACSKSVEGLFYHMEGGNLDLHPVCFVRLIKEAETGVLYDERGLGSVLKKLWEVSLTALSIFTIFTDISSLLEAFG